MIQENIQLQRLNTMSTPCTARWFVVVQSTDELLAALNFAQEQTCDFLVLGEGSNTLFDGDLDCLVIANRIGGAGQNDDLFNSASVKIVKESASTVDLQIGAGINWHELVKQSLRANFYGLESLALIPGLVGAAPIQNIGAYGVELCDLLVSVTVIDVASHTVIELSKDDCQFAYRDSVFKRDTNRYVITGVNLRLKKSPITYLVDGLYPALRGEFSLEKTVSSNELFDAVCTVRQSKLPDPKIIPNAGSFFKNPIVSKDQRDELLSLFPDLVNYPFNSSYKLAAAWLIDKAGIKGQFSDKGVGSYERQALVLINKNKNSGKNVLSFASDIQRKIETLFSVKLEIEPRIYHAEKGVLVCMT